MNRYQTPHTYVLDRNGVEDEETIRLCEDAMAVGASSMRGHVIGPWLEARTAWLISQWLPGWICSHAQLTDGRDFTMQSRSWDVVLHQPINNDLGYPRPSHAPHGYPLVPKHLACAIVNVKGNFSPSQLRGAMGECAYANGESSGISQMDYLGDDIAKIYLCFTSYSTAADMSRAAEQCNCGVHAYTLARLDNRDTNAAGRKVYRWTLSRGADGRLPLAAFREHIEACAARWLQSHPKSHESGRRD